MTVKRLLTGILAVLVVAAVMAPSLMAQSLVSGDLTGTISDPSGAVVSGATVTLKSDATGAIRNATTGANGTYRFSLLPPGSYSVMVTASGFSKTTQRSQRQRRPGFDRRREDGCWFLVDHRRSYFVRASGAGR